MIDRKVIEATRAVLDIFEARGLDHTDSFETCLRTLASIALDEMDGDNAGAALWLEDVVSPALEYMIAELRKMGGRTEPEPPKQ